MLFVLEQTKTTKIRFPFFVFIYSAFVKLLNNGTFSIYRNKSKTRYIIKEYTVL